MIEYVFRPSRKVGGKVVRSRLYSGAYSLGRGEKARRVALHTPSKKVALKMLRDIVENKQMEREGMVAPEAVRQAATIGVVVLIGRYGEALLGLGRNPRHVKGTAARLHRMRREMGWKRLSDVRPDVFAGWLSKLQLAAKSRKEYQVSAVAFLNWLVRTEQLLRNPLTRLENVEVRGNQVRPSRALRADEIEQLLAVSGPRRLVYLMLLYTGMRRGEAKQLRWSDVTLDGVHSQVMLRNAVTKGRVKRAIPLHPVLMESLRSAATSAESNSLIFPSFPRWEAMRADFAKAGIEHKDTLGRVAHFHSFRKTFQTLGVNAGVNQRSAQALLGHSDPSLTAEVYTDVAALELRSEVAKLPFFGVAGDAQKPEKIATASRFRAILSQLVNLAETVVFQGENVENNSLFAGARDRTRTCTPYGKGF